MLHAFLAGRRKVGSARHAASTSSSQRSLWTDVDGFKLQPLIASKLNNP